VAAPLQAIRRTLGRWLFGGAYDGTSVGRGYRRWQASSVGPTAAIAGSGELLRTRSHHLARNNPWGFAALDSFAANAVGTGIKPRSQHPDAAMRRTINQLWEDWADEAVSEGVGDLYAAQLVAALTVLEGGDCFVRLRPRRLDDGFAVPLQLNLYGGEMVPYWHTTQAPSGNRVICGIEFDGIGRKVAYWMHREHPGEAGLTGGDDSQLVRVPASEVLHLYRWRLAGQIRGEQALCRAVLRLYDLDEHARVEMLRQKAAASIAMVIVTPDPDKVPEGIGERDAGDPQAGGDTTVTLEPGTVPVLGVGQDIRSHVPADLASNLDSFIEHQLRAVAQSTGLTFEQLTGNLRNVNYSSARVGLLEQRRRMEPWQWQVMVHQFCRPLWRAFCDAAVASGALRIAGYAQPATKRAATRVSWHPQGWAWVDPVKEVTAQVIAVRAGFKSREMVIAETGYDPEVIEQQIAAENARADRDGRVHTTDPRKVTDAGVAVTPSAPPEPEDETTSDTTDDMESADDAGEADEPGDTDEPVTEPAALRRARGGRRG
jgi:lambda family phage portal protein